MNKMPLKKSGKRSDFVLEKSGKPQSDFCINPEQSTLADNQWWHCIRARQVNSWKIHRPAYCFALLQ